MSMCCSPCTGGDGGGPVQGCDSCDGDIQSFGSTDALFATEAQTTSRYILAGHRCLV